MAEQLTMLQQVLNLSEIILHVQNVIFLTSCDLPPRRCRKQGTLPETVSKSNDNNGRSVFANMDKTTGPLLSTFL